MKSLRISGLAGGLALVLSALAGIAQAQQAAPSDAGAMPAASADAAGVGPDCPLPEGEYVDDSIQVDDLVLNQEATHESHQ